MGDEKKDPDSIFKYLGFDIHPGKVGEFWQSESERKQYLRQVEARGGQLRILDRDSSLLNVRLMSTADKIISLIGSAILIIAFFLPVYSIDTSGGGISGSAISYFLNLPFIGGYAAWGGFDMILVVIVFSLLLLSCPVAGIMNILGILNKNKGDGYLATVKEYSRFTLVPIFLYILLFVLLLFGGPQPFGSLGTEAIGDSLNLAAIFTMTGVGFWLNIAGLAIGFAQSRGL